MHYRPTVYVNDSAVEMKVTDEAPLTIRDLIRHYGQDPERCTVFRLRGRDDLQGEQVGLNDTLPLDGQRPLFYRCVASGAPVPLRASSHRGDPSGHEAVERQRAHPREAEASGTASPSSEEARRRNVTLGSEIRRPMTPPNRKEGRKKPTAKEGGA